jgi:hypothetical protein
MRLSSYAAQKRYCLVLIAGLICAVPLAHGRAAEGDTFVLPAGDSDGYGIDECMHGGAACGQVVADSWCEAHGRGKALAFGSADDVTGSVGAAPVPASIKANDVVIRCGP